MRFQSQKQPQDRQLSPLLHVCKRQSSENTPSETHGLATGATNASQSFHIQSPRPPSLFINHNNIRGAIGIGVIIPKKYFSIAEKRHRRDIKHIASGRAFNLKTSSSQLLHE
jgi:hypothetical protein